MVHGIAITKPGYNALTEADPKNFIFDSTLNHLKTFASGSTSQTVAAWTSSLLTATHNLGYRPLVVAYYRTTNVNPDRWYINSGDPASLGRYPVSDVSIDVRITTTQVKFNVYNNSGSSKTVEIQFEIFYEGV